MAAGTRPIRPRAGRLYEARHRRKMKGFPTRQFPQPMWDGAPTCTAAVFSSLPSRAWAIPSTSFAMHPSSGDAAAVFYFSASPKFTNSSPPNTISASSNGLPMASRFPHSTSTAHS